MQSLVKHDAAEVVGPVSLQLWAQVFFLIPLSFFLFKKT